MSRRERADTVKDRIEEVRRLTPPSKGRKARKGYASKDDFADALGVSRSAVMNWTRDEKPSLPDEKARIALAKASRGRYQPEDFVPPVEPGTGSLELRVERLERAVEIVERRLFGEDAAPDL